jgi:hypothetical protein
MPGLIPDAEMAAMRATANSSFDTTIIVSRNVGAKSNYGTLNESWQVVNAAMPARIASPTGPLLTALLARVGGLQVWLIAVDNDADVRIEDRITAGTDTMRVHSVLAPTSYSTATQFVCAEIR